MRRSLHSLAIALCSTALACLATSLRAQSLSSSGALSRLFSRSAASDSSLARQLAALRADPRNATLPTPAAFTSGPRVVLPGSALTGPIGVVHGSLDVAGRVDGDVYVVDGDVVVREGGVITGNALAVDGRVTLDGGSVQGTMRSVRGVSAQPAAAAPPLTALQAMKLVFGWFAVLVVIGLGVTMFAEGALDAVVDTVGRSFARAFWFGLLGQVLLLPGLLVLCVALALTIIGALLIPFAIVAYAIAVAGLLTLGFLALARLAGSIFGGSATPAQARGAHVRAVLVGLVLLLAPWMIAAALTPQPLASLVVRVIALAVCWAAATVGLGATLLSRAGTHWRTGHREDRRVSDDLAWQTPTPVTGVAAARRPAAAPAGAARDS